MQVGTRDNFRVITVILGSPTSDLRTEDTKELLNYSFDNYKLYDISKYTESTFSTNILKGEIEKYEIKNNESLRYPLTKNELDNIKVIKFSKDNLEAPIKIGTSIGNLCIYANSELIYKKNILTDKDILRKSVYSYMIDIYMRLHMISLIR